MLLSARLQRRCWCGASNVAIHGDVLSRVNRCSSGNLDFQTSLLHPEPQPVPGPRPRREEGGKTRSTPSRPEPSGHAALRCPEAAEPGLGVPRRALMAPRCSEGREGGVLRLPGALRSSLDSAKSPRDGCGQLINSMGSELDISWLLSLCLIVSAGGGRGWGAGGTPGTGRWTRKELGDPLSWPLLPFQLLYGSPIPRGFRKGGLLAEGLGAQRFGAPCAIWAAPEAGSRAERVVGTPRRVRGLL